MLKKLISCALISTSLVGCSTAEHQKSDPEALSFRSIELETSVGPLAANLYLPDGIENPPVVVVTGAWTSVKEQMPATYAEALTRKGYAAVTFDFRGWGESRHSNNSDEVPYLEDPALKTADIHAVIDAVSQLNVVDGQRIAGLGICASSGYMLDAASGNSDIKAVAVVAPWLHDIPMATAIYGGPDNVKNLLETANNAEQSQQPHIIEAASLTNENALMFKVPYYTETDRGLIPEYDNKFNLASWSGWLNYDAQVSADTLKKPALLVASESMAIPAGAHQYLDTAGENVKSVWLEGYSQFDFYDNPDAVSNSVNAIDKFFRETL